MITTSEPATLRSYLPVPRIEILHEIRPPGEPHGPQYIRIVSDDGCRDIDIPANVVECDNAAARTICIASRDTPVPLWQQLVQAPESVPVVDRRAR